ncbi:hypothetical protein FS749_009249 [Ceratobasidium sp. UAMH 11750]|nr:hypothetical protein FS749_009249 [Ceratobasidium sp. UAMH 11750]
MNTQDSNSDLVGYKRVDSTKEAFDAAALDGEGMDEEEATAEEQGSESESGTESDDDLESEDQSDDESEVESELNGDGRMRASRYVEYEAREVRDTKQNKSRPGDHTYGVGDRWVGGAQGLMVFRKRPNKAEEMEPAKWSFSNDGAMRQPLKDRKIGDIHFSPVYSGGIGEEYWVLVDHPKRRWAQCAGGQAHPVLPGYVLRPRSGVKPPQWIRAQSLRANRWRGRSN